MIRTVVVSCVICLGTRTLLVFPYTGKERKGKERKGKGEGKTSPWVVQYWNSWLFPAISIWCRLPGLGTFNTNLWMVRTTTPENRNSGLFPPT